MTTDHDLDLDEATQREEEGLAVTIDQFDITKHDCVVTLVSPKTGDHRTFKVATVREDSKSPLAGKRIVSMLSGPDNTSDYTGFGFVSPDGTIKVWNRLKGDGEPSTWERFADLLATPHYWAARGVEYQFSLRCRRCGRPLTHPESLASGLGPVCEGR